MRVIQIIDKLKIESLVQNELPKPQPKPNQVLVKLEAASLNYVDLLVVKGLLNPLLKLPYVPICDGAGIVDQVGSGTTVFKPGDPVVTTFIPEWLGGKPTPLTTAYSSRPGLGETPGQLAEYKLFSTNQLLHRPQTLSSIEAATLPIAGLTAWNALQRSGLEAGHAVLVHGTGGVALFTLQFAKALGAKVIITSSSQEKLDRALRLGADFGINYATDDNWEKTVQKLTDGEGPDVIVETVGGEHLQRSLQAVRMGGYISTVGLIKGFNAKVDILTLLHKQVTLHGLEVGSRQDFSTMNHFIDLCRIRPIVDRTFPLEQIQEALLYLERGAHFGKIAISF